MTAARYEIRYKSFRKKNNKKKKEEKEEADAEAEEEGKGGTAKRGEVVVVERQTIGRQ